MKKNIRFSTQFLTILILSFFLITIIGFSVNKKVGSPTTAESSDYWRVYTNTKYSYMFKHPPTLTTKLDFDLYNAVKEASHTNEVVYVYNNNKNSDPLKESYFIIAPKTVENTDWINKKYYNVTTHDIDGVTFYILTSNDPEKQQIAEQILSTIKGLPKKSEWKTLINETYKFSIEYPEELIKKGGCYEKDRCTFLYYAYQQAGEKSDFGHASIVFFENRNYDAELFKKSRLSLNLSDYAYQIWKLNKDNSISKTNKKVGELTNTFFAGLKSFSFTISGTYDTFTGGEVLDKEEVFIFSEKGGIKFLVRYPTDNIIYDQILSTFKFIE